MAMWWCLTSAQRQAQKLISVPTPTAKIRLLSSIRIQSRVVASLLIGHNTLSRNLYIMWLVDISSCRRCGAEEETSAPILCECEALVTLKHLFGFFSSDPEDVRNLRLRTVWNFIKRTGLP